MKQLFAELKAYMEFDETDERRLRALRPQLQPLFQPCVTSFYARILEHPEARSALDRGERRVGQLKITLERWLEELFEGPWDDTYLERRARIGVVHVQIGLPQHYMVTAMNVVRTRLLEGLAEPHRAADRLSVNRVLDLDLAIMLHTYRLDMAARQSRAERLATYGQLVATIGHELRNPLGVIATSLFLLKGRGESDPKIGKHLDRISTQVTLANDIITQLLNLIRDEPVLRQDISLKDLFDEASKAVSCPQGIVIEVPADAPIVSGDRTQLRQVLVNLIENAVSAASPTGRVRLTASEDAEQTHFEVSDSGPGIDPSIAKRLFEPLVTTKRTGIGLGLALVKRIIERHGGIVEVSRSELGGARFAVHLRRTVP